MALTTAVESFTACIPELKEIIGQHWEKLALNRDKVPLEPRWDVYRNIEGNGELSFVTLRDRGKMVGYWITIVGKSLHYGTCLDANMDIWNVLPGYELGARHLGRAMKEELKRRGVNRSFVGEKIHRPCGKLYRALGYTPVETTYSLWIQD